MTEDTLGFTLWQTAEGTGPVQERGFAASSWRGGLVALETGGDDAAEASAAPLAVQFTSDGGDRYATAARFDNDVTLGEGALSLRWSDAGAELTQGGAWNTIKTVVINEFSGDSLVLRGFVHNVVDLADAGPVSLFLDGAKRASVHTGAGDDVVRIGAVANSNEWSRLFEISTGHGNDVVEFVDATMDWGLAIRNATGARSLVDLGAGDDIFRGGAGNDTVIGGAGDDFLDGGDGIDTAVFSGNFDDYLVALNRDGSFRVVGPDGTDTVRNFEFLQFADVLIPV